MNQYEPENSKWFRYHNLKPPETATHGTEESIDKIFEDMKDRKHVWKQQGNFIICTGCKLEHGHPIPPDQMLDGTDPKGLPILTELKARYRS